MSTKPLTNTQIENRDLQRQISILVRKLETEKAKVRNCKAVVKVIFEHDLTDVQNIQYLKDLYISRIDHLDELADITVKHQLMDVKQHKHKISEYSNMVKKELSEMDDNNVIQSANINTPKLVKPESLDQLSILQLDNGKQAIAYQSELYSYPDGIKIGKIVTSSTNEIQVIINHQVITIPTITTEEIEIDDLSYQLDFSDNVYSTVDNLPSLQNDMQVNLVQKVGKLDSDGNLI